MFRNFLNPDNALMVTMSQITDCILLSLMWLLGCFPLVTVGVSGAALYDSVRQCLRGTERNPLSRFLKSFRRDLKTGLIPGLLYLAALWLGVRAMIALWNSAVAGSCSWMVFAGCAFVAAMMLGILSVLFPLLSRFTFSFAGLQATAVKMAFGFLPRTVLLAAVNLTAGWLCLRFLLPAMIVPGIGAYLSALILEPVFSKYEAGGSGDNNE